VQSDDSLHNLKQGMSKFPQIMINVPLAQRIDIDASQPIQQAVQDAEACLNGKGRVLLRPSGTEPLVRVMVEGEDEILVREQAEHLADVVTRAL
jgi:phosphoglucosamine mutase